jgi:integrase
MANECLESIPTQSEYVFDTTNSAIASAWKRLRKTAKVKRVRFHDFRHEAISRFFEKGLTIPEVMSISGHRTASMLFRYAHADQSKIAEKLAC